jgi:methionyl aminopeptidase
MVPHCFSSQKPVIHTSQDILHMRDACKAAAQLLDYACSLVKEGMSTEELDARVHDQCIQMDCYPSPLLYHGFPKSCCTSVNNVACHGIPDNRPLLDGDILNIDISVYHRNGYHGDCSRMVAVGKVDDKGVALMDAAMECLTRAIRACGPMQRISAIGSIVEELAAAKGHSVCDRYGDVNEWCI